MDGDTRPIFPQLCGRDVGTAGSRRADVTRRPRMEEPGYLMSSREIIVKKDSADLSAHAAELFVSIGAEAVQARGSFSISLAGGSTPRKLYSLLSNDPYRSALDWSKVVFFFGDERNVPPVSPDSNFRMANETLLEPLGISPEHIFRWRTELGPEAAADGYEALLRQHMVVDGHGFDLVLLGLGSDGHTASLFPRSIALQECERLAVANWVDHLADYRLTVTFPTINRSSNVIFLVSGSEKAPVVAEVLEGAFQPDDLPAQFVIPENGPLYWLLDRGAAGNLT